VIPLPQVLHILGWEQLRLLPDLDAGGKATIGWGHLILPGEDLHREITRAEAHALFLRDLQEKEAQVHRALPVVAGLGTPWRLTEDQWGTLVAFCYNTGTEPLSGANGLGKALREGRYGDVPAEMRRWVYVTDKAGKKVKSAGLSARREDEVALWQRSGVGSEER